MQQGMPFLQASPGGAAGWWCWTHSPAWYVSLTNFCVLMPLQIGPLIEQYRQQLDVDKLEAGGFPVEEFGLRTLRPGADSSKRVTTGSGSS